MLFLKEHLQNNHYSWENKVTHADYEPARRLFDRANGNQVLLLINYFGKSIGRLTLVDGRKIEELIVFQLPAETKSELSVFNWLRETYMYYSQ